jgi:hypothetical protein
MSSAGERSAERSDGEFRYEMAEEQWNAAIFRKHGL